MGKSCSVGIVLCVIFALAFASQNVQAQCTSSDIMDPGFQFLTNSRGCAPFTVQMQTTYLNSNPGTVYYVDWGDGTPIETHVQTSSAGVVLQHQYPNSPIECGYDVIIDAENDCNPRGSVTPIETQVMIWTNDVISINPQTFRVCEGFAQELRFTDDSDWNCFPRNDIRENEDPRWIQWIYGTGDPAIRIPGITIDGNNPGSYPFYDPDPEANPVYPVLTQGQATLPIGIPATAAIGEEFQVTLRNWNQCNPYDNDIKDGNGKNPVSGDFANGDNEPVTTTARVVIVPAPEPEFQTRSGNSTGPVQTTFCLGEDIYFENLTPSISGAQLVSEWEFYESNDGSGSPANTSAEHHAIYNFESPGTKLIRLRVKDENAAGSCETLIEHEIFIAPVLQAEIAITDTNGNPLNPEFCQLPDESNIFTVRYNDVSEGAVTPDIRWRWEFYDENNELFQSEPSGPGFSATQLGPFDIEYQREGIYEVRLIIIDQQTGCSSSDVKQVKININPTADFSIQNACLGDSVVFDDLSVAAEGESIISWAYDILNDNTTDATFTASESWKYKFEEAGEYPVKLTVVSASGCSSTIIKNVTVEPVPEASISADQLSGCSELIVQFDNQSWSQTIPVDYYQWEINSGTGFEVDSIQPASDASLDGSFTRSFINNGAEDLIYQVRMLAFGENGCVGISETLNVTVTPGATSGFLFTNYSPFNNNCSPQDVSFRVSQQTQDLNPEDYEWEVLLGDSLIYQENTGSVPDFSHTFINNTNAVLEYAIRLTTTLSESCSSDSTLLVRINPVPIAEFTIDTVGLDCEMVTLRFNSIQKGLPFYKWRMEIEGTPIYTYEGVNDSFEYTFDRGTSDLGISVSLNTRNLANCVSEEVTKTSTVTAQNNFIAAFNIPEKEVQLPAGTVQIINQSSPGSWDYLWDFGDGQTSTDPDVTGHTYSSPGQYLIVLTISDGDCEKTYSDLVNVTSPAPIADFDFEGEAGCLPHKVVFTNYSLYGTSYLWDFGDGSTSTEEHPQHTYLNPGSYSVRLTVHGFNGEEVNHYRADIIQVYERPTAYFEVRPSLIYVPDMPIHTRNLSSGATSYYWEFGDGTVSTDFEPNHTYQDPGQYDITLEAYNDFCYDSLTIQGAVTAKIAGRVLIPNAFSPNRSGPGSEGSGDNDVFVPVMADVSEYTLQIFNRWGELLFEGHNQGWDGYYRGNLCAQDVYVYKLEVTFNNGEKNIRVGDVNLIR